MDHQEPPYDLPPEDPALRELDQQVGRDRKASRWMTWALLTVTLVACGLAGLVYMYANQARTTAEALAVEQAQEKQVLAEDARAVLCTAADVKVYEAELCDRLDAAASAGPISVRDGRDGRDGATGPRGLPGADGQDGQDGRDGRDGQDGQDGQDGLNGAPGSSGVGVNGRDGEAGPAGPPGPTGPQGPAGPAGRDGVDGQPGQDGRGITAMECIGEGTSSYVLVTFTDSSTTTWAGPCRLDPVFTLPSAAP